MSTEEELMRIDRELQANQAKGEALRQQIQMMQDSTLEVSTAIDALKNLQKIKGDALVPIGAGVYLPFSKPSFDHVVMNIGAGVMVQKTPEEAIKILADRQEKLSEALKSAQDSLEQVIRDIDLLNKQASSIAAQEERNVQPSEEQA